VKLAKWIAGIAALAVVARRWWRSRTRRGARGSLGIGLTDGVNQVGIALTQATGVSLVGGNRLAWRNDVEVFDAIEAAVRGARHSVHVDVYIWKPGQPGDGLAQLAARRAREGIAVRILVDPMG